MTEEKNKLKLVELFAGTGSFSSAFESTGKFKTIFANDFEKSSKTIFDENFDTKLTLKDINNIKPEEIPSMDILTSGFPCQSFSIAGKKLGFEDSRSNVFWKMVGIIKYRNPRIILLENVKNLLNHDKGNTFNIIKTQITNLGYYLKFKVLNVYKVTGIPQNRERVYILGFKNKEEHDKFEFPEESNILVRNISDFLDEKVDKKYYYTERFKCYDVIKEGVTKHISTNTVYQYRRNHVRENKSCLVPTLTANSGSGGHNCPIILDDKGIRKLTPSEYFKLQGFYDTYKLPKLSDSALYKLVGNSVSTLVVEKIANKLILVLDN